MKTWAVVLIAFRVSIACEIIFISAFDHDEAALKAMKACKLIFPSEKGFKEHIAVIRDTQSMYDELNKVHDWDTNE